MVRGMSIDEAVKQLSFVLKKGAEPVKEVLLEAQEIAVRDQNVEFKSNLWVGMYIMETCSLILYYTTPAKLVSFDPFFYNIIMYYTCIKLSVII